MTHDIIAQKYERKENKSFNLSYKFCRFSENLILNLSKGNIISFSKKDQKLLYDYYQIQSEVVDFYIEESIKEINLKEINLDNSFCFYGYWKREENLEGLLWFEKNILPSISKYIKIVVIGGGLNKEVKNRLNEYDNVEVLGFVKNPYKVISKCKGLIAPLFQGAGVKVKVIESLACGTPVIGTDVAFEGIEFKYKNYLKRVDSPNNYIDAIQELNKIKLKDKIQLKDNFNSNYPKQKFRYILSELE